LIFDRRINVKTPGTFRTRVVTRGVDPQLCCYYKASRLKQYFKLRHEVACCEWTRRQEGRLLSGA
jgi:hypothetical protein